MNDIDTIRKLMVNTHSWRETAHNWIKYCEKCGCIFDTSSNIVYSKLLGGGVSDDVSHKPMSCEDGTIRKVLEE